MSRPASFLSLIVASVLLGIATSVFFVGGKAALPGKCLMDGASCVSGTQCCGGSCEWSDDAGGQVCTSTATVPSCSEDGASCASSTDCCGGFCSMGGVCYGNACITEADCPDDSLTEDNLLRVWSCDAGSCSYIDDVPSCLVGGSEDCLPDGASCDTATPGACLGQQCENTGGSAGPVCQGGNFCITHADCSENSAILQPTSGEYVWCCEPTNLGFSICQAEPDAASCPGLLPVPEPEAPPEEPTPPVLEPEPEPEPESPAPVQDPLSVTLSSDVASVVAGSADTVTFAIVVTNPSVLPYFTTNVKITLPAGLQFASATPSTPWNSADSSAEWTIDYLAPLQQESFTVTATAAADASLGSVTAVGEVTGAPQATASTQIVEPSAPPVAPPDSLPDDFFPTAGPICSDCPCQNVTRFNVSFGGITDYSDPPDIQQCSDTSCTVLNGAFELQHIGLCSWGTNNHLCGIDQNGYGSQAWYMRLDWPQPFIMTELSEDDGFYAVQGVFSCNQPMVFEFQRVWTEFCTNYPTHITVIPQYGGSDNTNPNYCGLSSSSSAPSDSSSSVSSSYFLSSAPPASTSSSSDIAISSSAWSSAWSSWYSSAAPLAVVQVIQHSVAPTVVAPGGDLTYTIKVKNVSAVTATNVEVLHQLSPILTVNSTPATDAPVAVGLNQYNWFIPSLAPNQEQTFTVEATVAPDATPGEILEAKATISGGPELSANATVQQPSVTQGCIIVKVDALAAWDDNAPIIGSLMPFTFRIDSTDTQTTDSNGRTTFSQLALGSHNIKFENPMPSNNWQITGPSVKNVSIPATGSPPTCQEVTFTASEQQLPVTLQKSANPVQLVSGDTVDFTITLTNTDLARPLTIEVKDTLPYFLVAGTPDPAADIQGQIVTWTNVVVPANDVTALSLSATLSPLTGPLSLLNTARITNGGVATVTIDGEPAPESSSASSWSYEPGCIDVFAYNEAGDPIAGVIADIGTLNIPSATTDVLGTALLTPVLDGSYFVNFVAPVGWAVDSISWPDGSGESDSFTVSVEPGPSCLPVTLTLGPVLTCDTCSLETDAWGDAECQAASGGVCMFSTWGWLFDGTPCVPDPEVCETGSSSSASAAYVSSLAASSVESQTYDCLTCGQCQDCSSGTCEPCTVQSCADLSDGLCMYDFWGTSFDETTETVIPPNPRCVPVPGACAPVASSSAYSDSSVAYAEYSSYSSSADYVVSVTESSASADSSWSESWNSSASSDSCACYVANDCSDAYCTGCASQDDCTAACIDTYPECTASSSSYSSYSSLAYSSEPPSSCSCFFVDDCSAAFCTGCASEAECTATCHSEEEWCVATSSSSSSWIAWSSTSSEWKPTRLNLFCPTAITAEGLPEVLEEESESMSLAQQGIILMRVQPYEDDVAEIAKRFKATTQDANDPGFDDMPDRPDLVALQNINARSARDACEEAHTIVLCREGEAECNFRTKSECLGPDMFAYSGDEIGAQNCAQDAGNLSLVDQLVAFLAFLYDW